MGMGRVLLGEGRLDSCKDLSAGCWTGRPVLIGLYKLKVGKLEGEGEHRQQDMWAWRAGKSMRLGRSRVYSPLLCEA